MTSMQERAARIGRGEDRPDWLDDVIEGYLDTTQKVWESPLAEKEDAQGVHVLRVQRITQRAPRACKGIGGLQPRGDGRARGRGRAASRA